MTAVRALGWVVYSAVCFITGYGVGLLLQTAVEWAVGG